MNELITPPGSGMPQQPQAPAITVNPKDLEDVVCDKCGNFTFQTVILMKIVPGVLTPNGQPALTRAEALSCVVCNNIPTQIQSNLAAAWFKNKSDEAIEGSSLPGLELIKPGDENVDTKPTDG